MLRIENLHPTVVDKPILKGLSLAVLLSGCQAAKSDDFTQPLKDCIAANVSSSQKVSAKRAYEVLQICERQVRTFAYGSTKQAYRNRFDSKDPQVRQDYRDRKRAIEEMTLMKISDDIQPRFVRM